MTAKLLFLGLAALAGLTMALQGSLNAALGKSVGVLEATASVHALGLVLALALLGSIRGGVGGLAHAAQAPWYAYVGGPLGVLIVYAVARSIPRVGVAPATTAIVVAQVLAGAVIDHLGLFGLQRLPMDWTLAPGLLLLGAGAFLLLRS
ncbi:MAG: DMT family transporter [Acetobacteraceae bacterium]|nr:DMT family transporter [Acetobacteraceae bacterium]